MRSVWIYWVIAGVFTHVAYGKLAPWRNITWDSLKYEYKFTNAMDWWTAANSGCDDVGVLLVRGHISQRLKRKMVTRQRYWVGALEVYTPWKWTEDNTTLLTLKGSLDVSLITDWDYTLDANEPYLCYETCDGGPVGLQGQYCYCLDETVNVSTHVKEIRCPGSFNQYCGSELKVSVYDIDIPGRVSFTPSTDANCGYVYYYYGYDGNMLGLSLGDCNTRKYYACPGDDFYYRGSKICNHGSQRVCVSTYKSTWRNAMSECNNKLVKLKNEVMPDLLNLTSRTGNYKKSYWIGLLRYRTPKWIDGFQFSEDVHGSNRLKSLACVAMYKSYYSGNIYYERTSCWSRLPAICQIYKSKPTPVPTPPTTTMPTTRTHRLPATTSSYVSQHTATTLPAQKWDGTSETHRQVGSERDSGGLVAGIVVGVLVLLVLAGVIVLVWMKRKNRFCFQSDKMDSPRRTASPIHATSSVPNNYEQYNADVTNRVQYENLAYCAQRNTKALRGPIAVSSIDYDLAAADDTLQGTRHLADLPNGIRPRDDYELASPDDAKPETAYSADSSSYACPGDYFELEGPGDSGPETDDYELDGPADTAEYAVMDGKIASEEYNTLHETQRDRNVDLNYSHIGAAELTGDLYDTTEPTPRGRTDNDMYSHIKRDKFEDEDMYNHTDGSDDVPEQYDPEYSHIATK
ncbi:uncharacterized protein LOC121385675 isoform X2 [Gigantopelta aegis]|uniref:uncharacterized protein LOC121385675 isoform X2 n=1 Tax=Gigantopelta aegis TaxID=1735272 RepID=UPI001B88901D|nr:uncharacterized protein LOC121385675 isoform X2 [Gigantopelta aegis]